MAELLAMAVVFGVFLKKFSELSVIHLEWGLVRLEFASRKKRS